MSTKRTTESELGFLGKLVTQLYVKKAEAILQHIEDGMNADDAIDHRAVQAISKWVTDNGVYAAPDTENEDSPLTVRLREIQNKQRGKVVDFRAEAKENGYG